MPRKPAPLLAEAGVSGLKHSGGYIREEWHKHLQGTNAVRIYREMSDNDPVIGGFLYAIEMLVRQVDWQVQPNPELEDAEAEAAAEIAIKVDEARHDMEQTWAETVSEIMSMAIYGWSLLETVYKIRRGPSEFGFMDSKHDDGWIGWRALPLRSQDSLDVWDINPATGHVGGMFQRAAPNYRRVEIPFERALLFRTRVSKNNPEGRSLLRNSYRPWFFLKRIQEIEAIGIERDLAGLPVMEVPPEIMHPKASADQKAIRTSMQDFVQRVKRDAYEGVVIPSEMKPDGQPTGYKFKLLASGGRRPVDVDAIVKRYESRILISVLAELLLLGQDKVGSFALADAKTNMLAMSLKALLDGIIDVFNRVAIPRLCAMNGVPMRLCPLLTFGDVETPNLTELGTFISSVAASGALVPDDGLEQHLRQIASLPVKDPDAPHVDEMELPGEFPFAATGAEPTEDQTTEPETETETEPTETETETGPEEESEVGEMDASVALNGAQIDAVLTLMQEVAGGRLPRDSAINLISVGFNIPTEAVERILGSIGQGFVPTPPEED